MLADSRKDVLSVTVRPCFCKGALSELPHRLGTKDLGAGFNTRRTPKDRTRCVRDIDEVSLRLDGEAMKVLTTGRNAAWQACRPSWAVARLSTRASQNEKVSWVEVWGALARQWTTRGHPFDGLETSVLRPGLGEK